MISKLSPINRMHQRSPRAYNTNFVKDLMASPQALAVYYGPSMRNPLKQQKKHEGKYLKPTRISSQEFAEKTIRDSP
jgi:hypothetical protein